MFGSAAYPTEEGLSERGDRSFTGYIDIEARHLFFYFFESRSDPAKDDVIFWTNGGPGCSSSIGLFMELGTWLYSAPQQATERAGIV